ncbi:MAG: chromate efflux transporter [Bacillus sp. (in: Bacteria)]|nr:chromate efflux transporter [Bacillus sp. (in: firmicutes)]
MKRMFREYMDIFWTATKLGLTSFGGPVAHLAYFRDEYIEKKKWLTEKMYADLIALCQFLPGPASSQVGISIGMIRGGLLGGILSWLGFTLPSVLILIAFALFLQGTSIDMSGFIHGLKIVAVAVVAHAILGMAKKLTPDRPRIFIAMISATIMLLVPSAIVQFGVIVAAGLIGYFLYRKETNEIDGEAPVLFSKKVGVLAFTLFFLLLFGLPFWRTMAPNMSLALFDTFYRVGSTVFGGGHVVLPMLERELVPHGFLTEEEFLAGYGAAQAVPGPLFTLSSYLGMVISGSTGALVATIGVFLPSFLLLVGVLPFWNSIRERTGFRAPLLGVNSAVVGLLIAAFYDPVFTSAIRNEVDFVIAMLAFSYLMFWKGTPWKVVLGTVLISVLMTFV